MHPLLRCAALTAVMTVVIAGTADAHLSILRQGNEVQGANEPGDKMGAALAAGDFNGDGYDDLAMGCPGEDVGSVQDAGAIVVARGSFSGLDHQGSYVLTADDANSVVEAGAQFGFSLAAADFNNDGYDDLAVGVPYEDLSGQVNSGTVYFFKGTASGLQVWRDLTPGGFGAAVEVEDRFGWSLAAEDFDGDGRVDLAVGCPGENGNTGAVYYATGSIIGPLPESIFLPSDLGFIDETQGHFGHCLAVGNVIGDARPDLVVGAPYRTAFNLSNAGVGYIIRGSATDGLRTTGAVSFTALINDNAQSGAAFGTSLAVGNFLPGSYESIAVGEPRRWTDFDRAGRVHVVAGGAGNLDYGSAFAFDSEILGVQSAVYDEFGAVLEGGRFWGVNDGYDDLIIGTPLKGVSYGFVQVLLGGAAGLGNSGGYSLYQNAIGDALEASDIFGSAFALGRFDGSNDVSLAIGAPGEDASAGQVHDFAPWRQVLGLSCRTSLTTDCDGQPVFSQKPFQRMKIASTTKIMTVLLAVERTQLPTNDPRYVAPEALYLVPDWVADDVPGSQVPLVEGEIISLENLMYSCLLRSGNDAAHAIADLLYGPGSPEETVPQFVAEMNAKASALGMSGTHFHNPAGLDNEVVTDDLGDHYSTAFDMTLLSKFSMENPEFAVIAGTLNRQMLRFYPNGSETWRCGNIFGGVLQNMIQPASGIKGGWTPGAQATGCFSAEGNFGRVLVGTFYTPDGSPNYVPDAANLLALGLNECSNFGIFDPALWNNWSYLLTMEGLFAGDGNNYRLSSEFFGDADEMQFTLQRVDSDPGPATEAMAILTRRSDVVLEGGVEAILGTAPFERTGGMRIYNNGEDIAWLSILAPDGSTSEETLDPGDFLEIPRYFGPTAELRWSVANADPTGGPAAVLGIEEQYEWGFETDEDDPYAGWTARVRRDSSTGRDDFDMEIRWQGPDAGEFALLVHESDVVVSAPDFEPPLDEPANLRVLSAAPNPSYGDVALRFSLSESAEVDVQIYDASGRKVRSLLNGSRTPGAWNVVWDGRNDAGQAVAPGVYFYRVTAGEEAPVGGKLIRAE